MVSTSCCTDHSIYKLFSLYNNQVCSICYTRANTISGSGLHYTELHLTVHCYRKATDTWVLCWVPASPAIVSITSALAPHLSSTLLPWSAPACTCCSRVYWRLCQYNRVHKCCFYPQLCQVASGAALLSHKPALCLLSPAAGQRQPCQPAPTEVFPWEWDGRVPVIITDHIPEG